MRPFILLFLLSASIIPYTQAEPTLKGTPSELTQYLSTLPNTIKLYGEAEMDVPVKKGIVSFKISTEESHLKEALSKNQQLKDNIVSSLVKQGISADDITGAKFSSTPESGFWSKKAASYKVDNTLKITIHNEKEFQIIAGVIDQHDDAHYQGIELKHADKERIKYQLIEKALANVETKKKIYESKLNLNLKEKLFYEDIHLAPMPMLQREPRAKALSSYSEAAFSVQPAFAESKYYIKIHVEYYVNKK